MLQAARGECKRGDAQCVLQQEVSRPEEGPSTGQHDGLDVTCSRTLDIRPAFETSAQLGTV